MSKQLVYISPELVLRYGSSVNNIASLLCLLSNDGKKPVTATEGFLSSRTGIKVRTIANAKKTLSSAGLIKLITTNKGLMRQTIIEVSHDLVKMFDVDFSDHANIALSDTQDLHDRTCKSCVTDMQKLHDDNAKIASCDHANFAFKTNKTNIETNNETNNIAQKIQKTPVSTPETVNYDPDLEDLITAYEDGASLTIAQGDTLIRTRNNVQGESAPQIGNYTQNPNIATSVKNKGGVEGNSDNTNTPVAKKPKKEHKPRNPQVIPQSAEEVIPYIDKFLKRHEKEEFYKDLDKQYYAGVILDNYLRDDGTWRDNKGTILREPYRKVSGWISREYEAGKLRRKKDENRQQEMADYIAGLFKEIEEDKAKEAQQKQQGKQAPITADFEIVPDTPKTQILENKHI